MLSIWVQNYVTHHYLLTDQPMHQRCYLAHTLVYLSLFFLGCFSVIFRVYDMFGVVSVDCIAFYWVFLALWVCLGSCTWNSQKSHMHNIKFSTFYAVYRIYFAFYLHLNFPIPWVWALHCWIQVHHMLHCYPIGYGATAHDITGTVWVSGAGQYPKLFFLPQWESKNP